MKGWKKYEFDSLVDIAKHLGVKPETVLHWSRHDPNWPVELVFLHPQKRIGEKVPLDSYVLPKGSMNKLASLGYPKYVHTLVYKLRKENEELKALLDKEKRNSDGRA
jgi:hypothetical protein